MDYLLPVPVLLAGLIVGNGGRVDVMVVVGCVVVTNGVVVVGGKVVGTVII